MKILYRLVNAPRSERVIPGKGIKQIWKRWASPGVLLAAIFILSVPSCSDDGVDPVEEGKKAVISNDVDVTLPVDSGEVGLVINTRDIFRKGYTATEAEVAFDDYPQFNETLEINPVTNMAILLIGNEELTVDQQKAFSTGIAIEIIIYDKDKAKLAEYKEDAQVVDDSGSPLEVKTDLHYKIPPLTLKKDIPYYVQPEKINGEGEFPTGAVLMAKTPKLYSFDIPDERFVFKYFFSPAGSNTYYIQRANGEQIRTYYFTLEAPALIVVTEDIEKALKFELEQDAQGWVRIREAGSDRYLTIKEGTSSEDDSRKALLLKENSEDRFRLISSAISWSAEDMGTEYHQPIMPPAQLDFAYEATIRNCTPGMLTETVGNSEARESKRSTSTSETLELFGSATAEVGITVGAEVGGSAGVYSASASVNVSAKLSVSTSITSTDSKTIGEETVKSTEVSRSRSLEVPPFTGVQVYDAVRTVEGAYVPFTQVIRITANYDDGEALSGDEIRTQMLFNFVSGVPVGMGNDYVDIGIAGQVKIAKMYDVETGADELAGACE